MKKVLKWIGIILAGLVGLIVVATAVGFVTASARINQSYDVPVTAVNIPSNAAAIAHGEHLANWPAGRRKISSRPSVPASRRVGTHCVSR